MNFTTKLLTAILFVVASISVSPANAELVTNGDFEATPFHSGWTNTAATQGTGLFGSAQSAEFLSGANGRISQAFSSPARTFAVDFQFSPGTVAGNRTLNMVLFNAPNNGTSQAGSALNLRSDDSGNLQLFDGAWGTVSGGSGAFATGSEYRIRLEANDFGPAGTNTFDLFWSDAGSTALTNSATGLSNFQNVPDNADGYSAIAFLKSSTNGGYSIDNVVVTAVPEPSSVLLFGFAGLACTFRRRRK